MPHTHDQITVEGGALINGLILPSVEQATTTNGSLALTTTSPTSIVLTGTASGYSVVLPNESSGNKGRWFHIYNTTNQTISVKDNTGALLTTLAQNSVAYAYLQTVGTQAGVWLIWQVLLSSAASGIINYNIVSNVSFNTASTTDVVVTGFLLTPQAGTYAVWLNAQCQYSAASRTYWWSLYKNNNQLADTVRGHYTGHSVEDGVMVTQAIVSMNGTDTVDLRVHCDPASGNLTVTGRSILAIRIGT